MSARKGRSKKAYTLMDMTGKLVTTDKDNIFAPVFTGNLSSHMSQVDGPQGRDWGSKVAPTVRQNWV